MEDSLQLREYVLGADVQQMLEKQNLELGAYLVTIIGSHHILLSEMDKEGNLAQMPRLVQLPSRSNRHVSSVSWPSFSQGEKCAASCLSTAASLRRRVFACTTFYSIIGICCLVMLLRIPACRNKERWRWSVHGRSTDHAQASLLGAYSDQNISASSTHFGNGTFLSMIS